MSEEMVKPKQTRPKRSEQMQPHLEKGEVSRYIKHALTGFNLPPIDVSDIEQVKERCQWYFNNCLENDIRPSVAGLSNALGISRQEFHKWCVGAYRRETHMEYCVRVKSLLEELMEDYMQNGKINPVSGIFLMKNNFGYQDKQEVVLTPNTPLGEPTSPEELQQKYIEASSGDYDFSDDE